MLLFYLKQVPLFTHLHFLKRWPWGTMYSKKTSKKIIFSSWTRKYVQVIIFFLYKVFRARTFAKETVICVIVIWFTVAKKFKSCEWNLNVMRTNKLITIAFSSRSPNSWHLVVKKVKKFALTDHNQFKKEIILRIDNGSYKETSC